MSIKDDRAQSNTCNYFSVSIVFVPGNGSDATEGFILFNEAGF
jgi:hypothetical protein